MACERPIDGPGASAHNEHRERHANHEQVILKALSLLGARPIHKEAVRPMDDDNGHEHLTEQTEGDYPGEQAEGETQRAEKLRHDY